MDDRVRAMAVPRIIGCKTLIALDLLISVWYKQSSFSLRKKNVP